MLNLLVIRSSNIEESRRFYECLGLSFELHQHDKGAQHFAAEHHGLVFEIYPAQGKDTTATRLGFAVEKLDQVLAELIASGGKARETPKESPWGRRAVVVDPDGHKVELLERESAC
ncbi:MAG: VOC family protein [Cyanobacteria bacterium P01_A01_bin.17]